jgi:hypothetical protein
MTIRYLTSCILTLSFFTLQLHAQLTSSNLPILVFTTENGQEITDEPKVKAHLGIIWNGDGQINHLNDPFTDYNGQVGVEIRGSSSQSFPKKGYAVETQNPDGTNNNISILGLPAENDWILNGPYSDKSLMRNALAYILSGWLMDYAPRVKFCEVVINGNYRGVYILTEKIKRDDNRVNIATLNPDENSGDELTGGYILKFDKFDGAFSDGFPSQYPPFPGSQGQTFYQYHYPKADEITGPQKAYIQNYIAGMESVMKSANFADSLTGYPKYFDVESIIHFIFIHEIGRNVDGYRLSTYFYKDKDSKDSRLHLGPVWDFNLAFGNVDYCIGPGTAGWALNFNDYCPGDYWVIHFWWKRIFEEPSFQKKMRERWIELRADKLSNERIFHLVDSLENMLQQPAARNFQRWPVLGEYVWPNPVVHGSYQAEMGYLKNWLTNRLIWLDGAMPELVDTNYTADPSKYPKVHPNPFHEQVTFWYHAYGFQTVRVEIFNAQGQLMGEIVDRVHPDGINKMTWDQALTPGIYFYKIRIGKEKPVTGKLVKL